MTSVFICELVQKKKIIWVGTSGFWPI